MKKYLLTALAVLGFNCGSMAETLAQWDFNSNPSDSDAFTGTLTPFIGTATATAVGSVGSFFNSASGSSDPAGADANNSAWRIINFPTQSTGNKTAGVQFNLDTTGFENITLTWDQNNAGAASKYYRIQYSTDNGASWVDKDVINNSLIATWNLPMATISFATIPAANNNTNFGVRIVSEFQNTATGSGTAGYSTINGNSYNPTAALRLDMVKFEGTVGTGNVEIFTNPESQAVAAGQPATFTVIAGGGTSAIGFQWRTNGTTISGATNSSYSIAAAQFSDALGYDVIVTNSVNSVTSTVATLTVRTPLNLAWTGSSGSIWDSSTINWVNTNTLANVAYIGGDHVRFDQRGISSPTVNLAETVQPSSVTVDADFDYLLLTDFGGKISGTTGLTKRGTGALQIDTDNTYSGTTRIEAGTLQLGVASTHGTLGTGPVVNNGALVFNRTDAITIANPITGSGNITNLGKTVTLTGTNVYNGEISIPSGALILSGNQTINSTNVSLTAMLTGVGGPTIFGISGGITTSPTTVLTTYGTSAAGDYRATFKSTSGTNVWNGPIFLSGTTNGGGNNQFQVDNVGTDLTINGDVTGIDGFNAGAITLRGVGTGTMAGKINIPGVVNKTDAGTWTIKSTGNSWPLTTVAVGTLKLGINDALPTNLALLIGQVNVAATVDLAGFNQQVAAILDNPSGIGTTTITNSSSSSDSTLTLSGNSGTFSGVIANGATSKINLFLSSGVLTLAGNNTYTGTTTINGALTLTGNGAIQNSAIISLGTGGTLDASQRSDGSLSLTASQTLKGDGAFNITGNLASDGVIELKVDKSGSTLTGDSIQGVSHFTYGGTLNLVLSGSSLVAGDSIKLFTAASYSGAFANIVPATPGSGLLWDVSTLTTDGTLRVIGSGAPTVTAISQVGTNLAFSGTGGPANGTYFVITSTNIATPLADWTALATNTFDGSGAFSFTNGINPGVAQRFFSLKIQ